MKTDPVWHATGRPLCRKASDRNRRGSDLVGRSVEYHGHGIQSQNGFTDVRANEPECIPTILETLRCRRYHAGKGDRRSSLPRSKTDEFLKRIPGARPFPLPRGGARHAGTASFWRDWGSRQRVLEVRRVLKQAVRSKAVEERHELLLGQPVFA